MLTIIKISLAKLFHKPFNTTLSILLFAIGVALISLIIKTESFLNNQYKTNMAGIDLVVGAKGSPLQLILSSVLHIDVPTGNIPLEEANKVSDNVLVKNTIPIALGDSYQGFRIVGTNTDYLNHYGCEYSDGKAFSKPMQVVIGSYVSEKTGLIVGDEFAGVHGFMEEGHSHDDFKYTITGVLKESGNVTDKLIITSVESVWVVHGSGDHEHGEDCDHDHEHGEECDHDHEDHHKHDHSEHVHDENCDHEHNHGEHEHSDHNSGSSTLDSLHNILINGGELTEEEAQLYNELRGELVVKSTKPSEEITALLVIYENPRAAVSLPRAINQNTFMQAASPAFEMNRLISMLGIGFDSLRILAWVIIFISAINIFIYLLNVFNQSIYEIALLRLAGASKFKVVSLLYIQGVLLAVSGWIIGIVISYLLWAYLPMFETGSYFSYGVFSKELILLAFCAGIGLIAALIPSIKAYRNNIHFTLNH